MRILVLAYHYPPITASVNRTYNIIKYLSKNKNHKFFVISAKPSGLDYVDYTLHYNLNNVKVYRTYNFNNTFTQFFARIIKFLPDGELWPLILNYHFPHDKVKQFKPDIIYASMKPGYTAILAYVLSKKYNIPYVLDYRDPWYPPFYLRRLHRKSIDNAKFVLTVTNKCKKIIESQSSRNDIIVVENGVSIKEINKISPVLFKTKKFRICYTGAITPRHKIDTLIRAVANLPSKIKKNVSLEIVGSARSLYKVHEVYLKNLAKKKCVNANFYGYLPKFDSYKILKGCDVSYNGQTYVFPNAIGGKTYEYIAANKPILVFTKKGSIMESFVKFNNIGWIAYDINELSINIEDAYIHRNKVVKFSNETKKIRFRYDWESLLKPLDKIFR